MPRITGTSTRAIPLTVLVGRELVIQTGAFSISVTEREAALVQGTLDVLVASGVVTNAGQYADDAALPGSSQTFVASGSDADVSTITATKAQTSMDVAHDAAVQAIATGDTSEAGTRFIAAYRATVDASDSGAGGIIAQGMRCTVTGVCKTNYGCRVSVNNAKSTAIGFESIVNAPNATTGVWGAAFQATGGAGTPTVNGVYAKATGGAGVPYAGYFDGAVRAGDLYHQGTKAGFYSTAPIVKPAGVAVTVEAIHAALVALGLISA